MTPTEIAAEVVAGRMTPVEGARLLCPAVPLWKVVLLVLWAALKGPFA